MWCRPPPENLLHSAPVRRSQEGAIGCRPATGEVVPGALLGHEDQELRCATVWRPQPSVLLILVTRAWWQSGGARAAPSAPATQKWAFERASTAHRILRPSDRLYSGAPLTRSRKLTPSPHLPGGEDATEGVSRDHPAARHYPNHPLFSLGGLGPSEKFGGGRTSERGASEYGLGAALASRTAQAFSVGS